MVSTAVKMSSAEAARIVTTSAAAHQRDRSRHWVRWVPGQTRSCPLPLERRNVNTGLRWPSAPNLTSPRLCLAGADHASQSVTTRAILMPSIFRTSSITQGSKSPSTSMIV